MPAARLQSLMWLTAQTDGRRNNPHGQTGHGAQCACVQKTLPHAGPTLESLNTPPTERAVQTAGQDHLVLQLLLMPQRHIKVALHLVSIVCSAQKSYTIYQYRYLPWLSHWPPSSAMNKSQRTNFKSVYN